MNDFRVGTTGSAGVNPLYDLTTGDARKTPDPKTLNAGGGVNGPTGGVPDAPGDTSQTSQSFAAKMSLSAFMSGGGGIDTDVLLVQVAVSMRDTEATSQKAKINSDQEAKKAQMKEKEAKLEESAKKLEEAEEKKRSGSLLDKIKLAFEWLGAILAVALAAILIITGVGAAVGVALIAAAVVAIVMAVDSTVAATTGGLGIAGNISMLSDKAANANGRDPQLSQTEMKERAGKADMGFRITMAVLGIGLAIASGGASFVNGVKSFAQAGMAAGRAGAAAADAAETTASVGKTIKDVAMAMKDAFRGVMSAADDAAAASQTVSKAAVKVAEMTGKSVDDVLQTAQTSGRIVSAVTDIHTIGHTGAEAASIGLKFQATAARSDATKLQSAAKADEAVMQMLDDMIDQALSRLIASGDRFAAMLDTITDAIQDRGNTLGRARFQG